MASRRPPEALAVQAEAIGPTVTPRPLAEALAAQTVLLAVLFRQHREVGAAAAGWDGRTVVNVTNAFGVAVEELGGLPSSAVVARADTVGEVGVSRLFTVAIALVDPFSPALDACRAMCGWVPWMVGRLRQQRPTVR